ncbi:MAG TPA: hypothetical protein VMB20_14970 [Candidatus Acidoferrum sp.]|nr:hypothetical protein [Candidatus Acidoferrum sp.]
MISDDELAAIAAALAALTPAVETEHVTEHPSRWKLAARNPDLEIEEYRSV